MRARRMCAQAGKLAGERATDSDAFRRRQGFVGSSARRQTSVAGQTGASCGCKSATARLPSGRPRWMGVYGQGRFCWAASGSSDEVATLARSSPLWWAVASAKASALSHTQSCLLLFSSSAPTLPLSLSLVGPRATARNKSLPGERERESLEIE